MLDLCRYSHALGVPNKGAHAIRFGGVAIIDVLLAAGVAGAIAKFGFNELTPSIFLMVFIVLIMIAVGLHELFCVRTRFNAALFGREWPDPSDL